MSNSVVVIAVRKGNAKGIKNSDDLVKPGIKIVTPDPGSSGSALGEFGAVRVVSGNVGGQSQTVTLLVAERAEQLEPGSYQLSVVLIAVAGRRLHDEMHVTTVFVTHDQEEALEVSDSLVVINHGRIEQVGTPTELYDHPKNDFMMGFPGPVTELDGRLVRPHDIEMLLTRGQADALELSVGSPVWLRPAHRAAALVLSEPR